MGSSAFAERVGLLLLESTHISAGVRGALFGLIGLLLVALGFLVACAWMLRKQSPAASSGQRKRRPKGASGLASELRSALASARGGAKEVIAIEGPAVGCPTCRREYDDALQFCPRDARRLVPVAELERIKGGGSVCPGCRRAFDPGVRFCPHDAAELVPVPIYQATHDRESGLGLTGVIAKICPQCRRRHDLSASFCGKDGSELAVIN